ncbi:RHS repeat-associated core domain-containing protein, partial [Flavobacterium sp. ST-75]
QNAPTLSPIVEGDKPSYRHYAEMLNIFYFHPDHLGSSSYISNLAGNVSQHIEYMPFGEMLVDEHINSFNTPFKFNGKEFDEETGNYYYSARYYDPKWSMFIGVDPLAEKYPDWSSYAYCFNNPVKLVDPTGMEPNDPPPGGGDQGGYHKEYTVQQYISFFEKSHNITMNNDRKYMLKQGCIGMVFLELYGSTNDVSSFVQHKERETYLPSMEFAYSKLDKAIQVMNEHNAAIKDNNKEGRAFVFAIRFYESTKGECPVNETTNEVDMSGWKLNVPFKNSIMFDYGVYNENTQKFWHANHQEVGDPNDPMMVHESDVNYYANEYPASFNRTVYCVGYSSFPTSVNKDE